MKFTHGMGDGQKTGCLMTMGNSLIGHSEDLDKSTEHNKVCTVLRSFIISTNDTIPVDILNRVYAPLAEKILGTITKDPKVMQERAIMFAEWADNIPRPKRMVVRTSLTEWAYEQFRLGKDPQIVAADVAAKAAQRAITVMRGKSDPKGKTKVRPMKDQNVIAEACRDILAKVTESCERQPITICNTQLQQELAGAR